MSGAAAMAAPHGHLRSGRARASFAGALWSFANAAVGALLAVVVFYVASRFLSPHDFGVVALAVSIVSLASALAPAAFGEALVQRAEVDAAHLDTVFWLSMAAAAVLYVPILLVAPAAAAWLGEPALAVLLPFVGLRLFFEMFASVPHALIVRRMRFRVIALRTAVANGAAAAVCIGLLVAGHGFWALALSQMTAVVVAAAVEFWSAGWRPGRAASRRALRDLAPYGIYATGSQLVNMAKVDQLLIGALGGTVFAGLYNFGHRLFQLLTGLIAGALAAVGHALFSSLQSEPEKAREGFLAAVFASALVAFPIFAGLILVADPAIPLIFGPQWAEAVVAVRALAFVGLLASISVVQASLITGFGRAGWWFGYQLVREATSVIVIVAVLPYGFAATMTALAVKAALLWPVSVVMTTRLIGIGLADYARVFLAPLAGVAVMAAAVLELPSLVPFGGGALLAAQVGTGAIIYTLVAGALAHGRLRGVIATLGIFRKAAS